jgi:EamA-like transporter family.
MVTYFKEMPQEKRERLRLNASGILWKLLACAAFAGVNTCVRYLTGGNGGITNPLPSDVIVFFEYLIGFMVMVPFTFKKGGLANLTTKRPIAHTIRIAAAVLGVISMYAALASMPMTHAVALQFTGPVFTVIGAKLYLKEGIGSYRALGVMAGIIGAFVLTRPDIALFSKGDDYLGIALVFPLLSAILFAIAKLSGRDLAASGERPELLTFYLIFFMIPASAIPAAFHWVTPTLPQLGWLFILAVFGTLAHYTTARAYALAEVIFLTPFGFARLIFTALLGFYMFGELPRHPHTGWGIACIILSVLAMSYGEIALRKRRLKALTAERIEEQKTAAAA